MAGPVTDYGSNNPYSHHTVTGSASTIIVSHTGNLCGWYAYLSYLLQQPIKLLPKHMQMPDRLDKGQD